MTGLGIFFGLLAGVIVQILAQLFWQARNRNEARRLLEFEVAYNLELLPTLEKAIRSIKDKASARDLREYEVMIDMTLFMYRGADALMNHGMFHNTLSTERIRDFVWFWNTFNTNTGQAWGNMIRQKIHAEAYGEIVRLCDLYENNIDEAKRKLSMIRAELAGGPQRHKRPR